MGTLQIGHGSEFHLLRFLGRHRDLLGAQIRAQLADDGAPVVAGVEWLDFPLNPKAPTRDGEVLSVDFLADHGGDDWRMFWPDQKPGVPNRRGMPSWDAVGRVRFVDRAPDDWLLVEAKAHLEEFASPQAACGARGQSRIKITKALRTTFEALRAADGPTWESVQDHWRGRYYQLANRLALLQFLRTHGRSARLLYVFFAGDEYRLCPASGLGWLKLFEKAYRDMGIGTTHPLSPWCHRLCLHVKSGDRV